MNANIFITGVVQGVGFRPFVKKLADSMALAGYVLNSDAGVEIFVSAPKATIETFAKRLLEEHPKQAHIAEFRVVYETIRNGEQVDNSENFEIFPSKEISGANSVTFIPTDLAICPECASELLNPADRRYRYPFINCTQCGPRFTIIESLPYDRAVTTMKDFAMCHACAAEYTDKNGRRFHAQPNACPDCGPQVQLVINDKAYTGDDPIQALAERINNGEIAAIRGIGGYNLICDAASDTAIAKLRTLKERPTKPLAIMCKDISFVEKIADISELERAALLSSEAPIVTVNLKNLHCISTLVNPLGGTVGVMLPYSPLHLLIMNEIQSGYMVATSGNLHHEPIISAPDEASSKLSRFTKTFLHHNREIFTQCDDSVATLAAGEIRVLRRARGYAPYPVAFCKVAEQAASIFAAGSHLKNSFTITKGRYAFVSQYIGDLDSVSTMNFYEESHHKLESILKVRPRLIARDMHDGYASSTYAESLANALGVETLKVQHHIAHTYAAMAEYGVTDNVISVCMDGTGYGLDGAIWGGEFFTIKDGIIERAAHLPYVPQPAGDASSKYPAKMAQSYLVSAGCWDDSWLKRLNISDMDSRLNMGMIINKLNCVDTSSAGRLFESVGAMALGIYKNEYEAHAAMALESYATRAIKAGFYKYYDIDRLDTLELVRLVANDINNKLPAEEIAAKFHITFAKMTATSVCQLAESSGLQSVAISGGVFQNKLLLELLCAELGKIKLKTLVPKAIPINDGGVSLGQAYYAYLKRY